MPAASGTLFAPDALQPTTAESNILSLVRGLIARYNALGMERRELMRQRSELKVQLMMLENRIDRCMLRQRRIFEWRVFVETKSVLKYKDWDPYKFFMKD